MPTGARRTLRVVGRHSLPPETLAMRLPSLFALVALLSFFHAAIATAGDSRKLFKLVNRGFDSVVSLSIAPAGTDAYREVYLGEPLRGGGESATVEIPMQSCRYDFRFALRNGRVVVYDAIDVCRGTGLRIEAPPSPGKT
jgi:hypothetical protein